MNNLSKYYSLREIKNRSKKVSNFNSKYYFVGISVSPNPGIETGIAIIDRDLNLIRVDKLYNLNELAPYIMNVGPATNIVACVDLPKNLTMLNGKWKIQARYNRIFKINKGEIGDFSWAQRFSDRGTEICSLLNTHGIDTYRYYSYFTKNMLHLNGPYKSRSPEACKHLQMSIQNILNVKGVPQNLIPLSGLDAIIGAYTARKASLEQENQECKCVGTFKDIPIISAL